MKQKNSSIVTLALILAAGGTNFQASAQTAADTFPLPTSVASGTKVQIDGSSSLQAVNQGLKERFQKQFSGTDVTIPTAYQGSDNSVKAVASDKLDLAGIGRPLTDKEKAQGLAAKTIGRAKIAIIVKDSNPYTGNLTLKDFAKIYRGEVTDWSQLPSANGAKGKIKVIDRPESSDTRRAFANYPVFQGGKLKTGSNAEKITDDSTQAVIDKLGNDGIGYAPADQIKNISGIRAVTLHGTQPNDPKYPFSQPLVYAYKNQGGKVSDGAKAFLGYATNADGKSAIQEITGAAAAGAAASTATPGATASPDASATPGTGATGTEGSTTTGTGTGTTNGTAGSTGTASTTSTTTTTDANKGGGIPWWLLPAALVGGGLWWLLGRKGKDEPAAPIAAAPATTENTPPIAPLYPPPPARTSRGDGLSGDLSGDLSANLGSSYRPSEDLRSGDLRSGDLSGMTIPPTIDRPNLNTPNVNLNGTVEQLKNKASDIGLAGGAAIAGGAAAAAAMGKGAIDSVRRDDEDDRQPPHLDLNNPLDGIKDKSSNLMPDLEINNPLDGIKDKASDLIEGGGAAAAAVGGAALAGGAAVVGGAQNLFANREESPTDGIEELELPESSDLSWETPELQNPLDGIGNPLETLGDKVGEVRDVVGDRVGELRDGASNLIPDANPGDNDNIFDRAGDFLKDGGGAAMAAGGAAIAGGAAFLGGLGQKAEDAAPELKVDNNDDPFNFGNPETIGEVRDGDTNPISAEDPFDFSNHPFDAIGDKAGEVRDAVGDKVGELRDGASNLIPDAPNNFLGDLQDKAGDLFEGGSTAIGAAGAGVVAGGAALFGGNRDAAAQQPSMEMDTFDRDLADIDLSNLDEDPFAGLSDLLGEDTGDMSKDKPSADLNSGFFADLKDKAGDLLEEGKNMGGAAIAGGAAAAAGAGAAAKSFFTKDAPADDAERSSDLSGSLYTEGHITLVSPNSTQVYTHWEIPVRLKRQLREQGGEKLVVRLYDVTDVDPNIELPTAYQEYECSDSAWDLEIPLSRNNRRYLTEIGYTTADGRWLMLARSTPLMVR